MDNQDLEYQHIDAPEQLRAVVAACENVAVLAIDTEFARFNTYYPIVGLIQICNGSDCFLIDPLVVGDLAPLAPLMVNPDIVKVFHACSEDLEVFQRCMGVVPTPLFDSQIAAALLGVGFSMSYQNLVDHYLGIKLPKDETRSDWLQRPLTKSQLDYAALDVVYLFQIHQEQATSLAELGRTRWVEEECTQMGSDIPTMVEPGEFYRRIRGAQKLDRQQLNVLKVLCAWREQEARKRDVPRNRIVDQRVLMTIARKGLNEKTQFQDEANMTPRQLRKYGEQILVLVDEASSQSAGNLPDLMVPNGSPVDSKQLKRLRLMADERAAELGVSPELLVKRRHLEQLMQSQDDLPEGLKGWRQNAVGNDLLRTVSSWMS